MYQDLHQKLYFLKKEDLEKVWDIVSKDTETIKEGSSKLKCNLSKISLETLEELTKYINSKLSQYESQKQE